MKLQIFLVFQLANIIFAQNPNIDEAINSIFSRNSSIGNFLDNYEEITQPPLKSLGALAKCGEGEQTNQYVCVPYFNCNPDTNTVQEDPDSDGTNKIDIRMQDETPKCDHYLEICCKLAATSDNARITELPPIRPKPITPTPKPQEDSGTGDNTKPNTKRVNCGIRNAEGLDFNLVGQTNEANFGEFPWMVAILRKNLKPNENLAICGGSLIGPRVVLTGAHCVYNVTVDEIKIRAGEWDTQTQNERIPYQERNVAQKIVHEHFLKNNLYNDIALLILDRPLTKTASIGTVCLPNQNFDSKDCFATGWGKNIFGQNGRYAVILKKLQLPLVQKEACQRALRKTRLGNNFVLHRSFICAGGEPDLDTCTGDGGSPLVCPDPNNPGRYLQVGIVAWGIGCGENQVPGVYVDVAQFNGWVEQKLQNLGIDTNSYKL